MIGEWLEKNYSMLLNVRNAKFVFIFLLVSLFASVVIIFVFHKGNNFPKEVERNNSTTTAVKTGISQQNSSLRSPLNEALSRIIKKPFGIYVSPKNSTVIPEKFIGLHTGVDFETFQNEQNSDVSVVIICSGKLLVKRQARGYGGMVVQSCLLDDRPITVLYGHLRLSSVKNSVGETLNAGDFLGFLGTGFSVETDGERKHLHLGIHLGEEIDTRGYTQTQSELKNWLNIESYLR